MILRSHAGYKEHKQPREIKIFRFSVQVAAAQSQHKADEAELSMLHSQIEELQAVINQAVEELEARASADVKQKAAAMELSQQMTAKDAEIAELRSKLDRLVSIIAPCRPTAFSLIWY